MLLEEGVSAFLKGGFTFISLVLVVGIIVILGATKSWKAATCFTLQGLLTWGAFRFFWNIIARGGSDPMLTENNSFDLGMCGVCWSFSIGMMLVGIYFLVRQIKTRKEGDSE